MSLVHFWYVPIKNHAHLLEYCWTLEGSWKCSSCLSKFVVTGYQKVEPDSVWYCDFGIQNSSILIDDSRCFLEHGFNTGQSQQIRNTGNMCDKIIVISILQMTKWYKLKTDQETLLIYSKDDSDRWKTDGVVIVKMVYFSHYLRVCTWNSHVWSQNKEEVRKWRHRGGVWFAMYCAKELWGSVCSVTPDPAAPLYPHTMHSLIYF